MMVQTMSRLRRVRCDSTPFPVLAEILEARSLLSAGAGALHAAASHATHATAGKLPAVTPPPPSGVPVVGSIDVRGIGTAANVPGTLSLSISGLQYGDPMSGAFNLSQGSKSGGGDYVTAKGTFSGHITAIVNKNGGPTLYIMVYDKGKVHEVERLSGTTTRLTAPAPHDPVLLMLLNGDSSLVQGDLSYSIPRGKGGGALHFQLVPPAG
jgi:hypothetical protein